MPKVSRRLVYIVSSLIGIAAFCSIPFFVGVRQTLNIIAEVGIWGIIVFCLNGLMILVAPSLGWNILINDHGQKVPFASLLKASVMGYPVNFLMPSMYLGSEPLRMYYIAKVHDIPRNRVLASIIVSRFQEFFGIAFISALSVLLIIWSHTLSRGYETIIIIAVVVFALGIGILVYAFLSNFKPSVKVLNLLAKLKIAAAKIENLKIKAEEMEQFIKDAFIKRWKTFLVSQFLTLLSAISVFLRPLIFFFFSQRDQLISEFETQPLTLISSFAIIFVLTQIILTFHLVPGCFGIFEGGVLLMFKLAGYTSVQASAFLLITRISDITMFTSGSYLISHYGLMAIAKKATQGSELNKNSDPSS